MDKMTAEKALERFRQDLLPDPHDERDIDASWIRRRWEQYEPVIRQALSAPRVPTVPEGWKLAPVEPANEMLDAVCNAGVVLSYQEAWRVMIAFVPEHESMLSASPEPVAQSPIVWQYTDEHGEQAYTAIKAKALESDPHPMPLYGEPVAPDQQVIADPSSLAEVQAMALEDAAYLFQMCHQPGVASELREMAQRRRSEIL